MEIFLEYAHSMIEQEFLSPKYILELITGPDFEEMQNENEGSES